MKISMIVAASCDGIIGIDNKIPWNKPADMRRFKELTMGGTLIMGRKTFDSMKRRHLPGRHSIVVSRSSRSDVDCVSSIEEALSVAKTIGHLVWVIGGSEIYDLAYPYVDEIDYTVVTDYKKPAVGAITYLGCFGKINNDFLAFEKEVSKVDLTLSHCLYKRRV